MAILISVSSNGQNPTDKFLDSLSVKQPVLILHGFIKKDQKTPLREIETALKRFEEYKKSGIDK
ncbi:hypothetical protein COS54_01550 [Candidatus Shapirobacteria bacterium CG03_land_8_20_14_0_80_39_12]|uniref:Uncharacterized protein n=1 Tax=Candidatus Shapirobacteria bacterium CG03_land_8_20_14_0_80_39_12 TaxID=1974879 RepID=A0A2M7BDG1_9BACT|nr:MAG: hypothetical protein COS54_01550 [Candidatus Shapirobacteria bacterium CG03_land_8_20_14_0_80_39_12]